MTPFCSHWFSGLSFRCPGSSFLSRVPSSTVVYKNRSSSSKLFESTSVATLRSSLFPRDSGACPVPGSPFLWSFPLPSPVEFPFSSLLWKSLPPTQPLLSPNSWSLFLTNLGPQRLSPDTAETEGCRVRETKDKGP